MLEFAEKENLDKFFVKNRDKFKDNRYVMKFFRQIVEGVAYLHSKGYVHADIKGGNIVVMGDETPKLIDFDLVAKKDATGSMRGTPLYINPRIYLDGKYFFDAKVDVYSLGVLLFYMINQGMEPYLARTEEALKTKLAVGMYTIPEGTELRIAILISKCIARAASNRPTVDQILAAIDAYLESYQDKLVKAKALYSSAVATEQTFEVYKTVNFARPQLVVQEEQEEQQFVQPAQLVQIQRDPQGAKAMQMPTDAPRFGGPANGKKKNRVLLDSIVGGDPNIYGKEIVEEGSTFHLNFYLAVGALIGLVVIALRQLFVRLATLKQRSIQSAPESAQVTPAVDPPATPAAESDNNFSVSLA